MISEYMSFEEIYKSTFGYVYRFFYYKSVNKASIEDLSHDVFFRFFKKYGDNPSIKTAEIKRVLFGFCRNVYREWVRNEVKEKRESFFENFDYDEFYEDFVDDKYEERLEIQKSIVLKAMEKLNEKVKAVLIYRFVDGMTRKEVSEKLNINEKDVHTYQKRGIKYLKKIIGEIDLGK